MAYVESLLDNYRRQLAHGLSARASAAERVWFAVYPPAQERRVRSRLDEFAIATRQAGYRWHLINLTNAFGKWLAGLEYREAYFNAPEDLEMALDEFGAQRVNALKDELASMPADEQTIVAVLGVAALFGFLRVSWLVEAVAPAVRGRLLVFFPGEHEQHNYRLLDARDGWDYLAVPIKG